MMNYCSAIDPIDAEMQLAKGGLSQAEIADTLQYLRSEGYRPAKLQKLTGFKDYTVRHYLRISKKLAPAVKDLLHRERITFSLARAIASLSPEEQEEEARKAVMSGTSVHRFRDKLSGDDKLCDEETRRYFERLAGIIAEQTGIIVSISPDNDNKQAGTISLRYTDLRDFDAICTRLRVDLSEI
ncbi:MAG: hypothetical protein G8D89_20920 [gamma proteobacterium symbiont of Clathrolucina costata]